MVCVHIYGEHTPPSHIHLDSQATGCCPSCALVGRVIQKGAEMGLKGTGWKSILTLAFVELEDVVLATGLT